jgi:recombination protein RecT
MSSDTRMTTTQAPGAMQSKGDPRISTLRQLFDSSKERFAEVIPRHLSVERMLRISLACITRDSKLLECSPASLLQCVMQLSEMGLEPGGVLGEAYLVPYKGVCTVIPGYRGLVTLARRGGYVRDVEAAVVREGDFFRYERGIELKLKHKPKLAGDQDRKIIAVYMIAHLKGTPRPHVEVMSIDDVLRIRERSQAWRSKGDNSPWGTDFAEMAKKTVVRRGMKMLPMSVELAKAIELDNEDAIDVEATEVDRVLPARGKGFTSRLKAASAPSIVDFPMEETPAPAEDEHAPGPESREPKATSKAAERRQAAQGAPATPPAESPGMTFEQREAERSRRAQEAADAKEAEEAERHFAAEEAKKKGGGA